MGCLNEGSSVRVVEGDDLKGFYAGAENGIRTISIGYDPELHDDDGVMAPVHMVDDEIDMDDEEDDIGDNVFAVEDFRWGTAERLGSIIDGLVVDETGYAYSDLSSGRGDPNSKWFQSGHIDNACRALEDRA